MRMSFFGPSPLLANNFYIQRVFFYFFWQQNLVLARENPLTVKWISQFMSFEFNFVTLAGAPALCFFFRCGRRHLAHLSGFVLLYWFRSRSGFGTHYHSTQFVFEFGCGLWLRCLAMVLTFLGYNFLIFIYFYNFYSGPNRECASFLLPTDLTPFFL